MLLSNDGVSRDQRNGEVKAVNMCETRVVHLFGRILVGSIFCQFYDATNEIKYEVQWLSHSLCLYIYIFIASLSFRDRPTTSLKEPQIIVKNISEMGVLVDTRPVDITTMGDITI